MGNTYASEAVAPVLDGLAKVAAMTLGGPVISLTVTYRRDGLPVSWHARSARDTQKTCGQILLDEFGVRQQFHGQGRAQFRERERVAGAYRFESYRPPIWPADKGRWVMVNKDRC